VHEILFKFVHISHSYTTLSRGLLFVGHSVRYLWHLLVLAGVFFCIFHTLYGIMDFSYHLLFQFLPFMPVPYTFKSLFAACRSWYLPNRVEASESKVK